MEHETSSWSIQAIEVQLAACEKEISALAREAVCPSTTGARRVEVLILRAQMQSKSVFFIRELQRLQADSTAVDCAHKDAKRRDIALDPPKKQLRSEVIHEVMQRFPSRKGNMGEAR